jgi:hypothetical protein
VKILSEVSSEWGKGGLHWRSNPCVQACTPIAINKEPHNQMLPLPHNQNIKKMVADIKASISLLPRVLSTLWQQLHGSMQGTMVLFINAAST